MARVFITRYDDINHVQSLLEVDDTALINRLDTSGSGETLVIGSGSASEVVLGRAGSSVIVSGSALAVADLTASAGLSVTASVDLPGQTSFALDGVAVSSENFTAGNLSRLFDGSNVDDLHSHAIGDVTGSLVQDSDFSHTFTTEQVISGSKIVYVSGENRVSLADADNVDQSRVIGVASGSSAVIYTSGSTVPVLSVYGDRFGGFSGLTAGTVYYLSTVAGEITSDPDLSPGKSIVQVGIAVTPSEFVLQPDFRLRRQV